jgi:hypothetical protein
VHGAHRIGPDDFEQAAATYRKRLQPYLDSDD